MVTYHKVRVINRIIGLGVISAISPTAMSQIPFTTHPTGTLRRVIVSTRMSVRILSAGSPHVPAEWISEVFPSVSVQFDSAGLPPTPADPGTGDARILQYVPMRHLWRPASDSTELYGVDYWTEQRIDTDVQRKGTGSGTNYPTVTAYLWTNDQSNWLGSSFWSGTRISYQNEMSVIYSDLT